MTIEEVWPNPAILIDRATADVLVAADKFIKAWDNGHTLDRVEAITELRKALNVLKGKK